MYIKVLILLLILWFKLRRLVEQGVSQDELSQILGQLRAMIRESTNVHPPPPSHVPQPPVPSHYPQPRVPVAPFATGAPGYSSLPRPQGQEPIPNLPVPSSSTSVPPTTDISNLFKSLVKAGLVTSGAPAGAEPPAQSEESKTKDLQNVTKTDSRRYAKLILSKRIKLTTADISK